MKAKLEEATTKSVELKQMIDEAFSIIPMVEFNLVPVTLTWKKLTQLKEYLVANENNANQNIEEFKEYEESKARELIYKKRLRFSDVRDAKYEHLEKTIKELETNLPSDCAKTNLPAHLNEMEQTTEFLIGHLVMTQLGVCVACIDPFSIPVSNHVNVLDRVTRNFAVVHERDVSKGKSKALSEEFVKKTSREGNL